jgi:hypothetical protein
MNSTPRASGSSSTEAHSRAGGCGNYAENAIMDWTPLLLAIGCDLGRILCLCLRHLNDQELLEHFRKYPHERRIYGYTSTTVETLSMRWLRGNGVEVGAGAHPTPLFGEARTQMSDCDRTLALAENSLTQYWVDDPEFARTNLARYDFSIASHVLEHADSFLRALENLLSITRVGGHRLHCQVRASGIPTKLHN